MVSVTLDLPESLVKALDLMKKVYGMRREEFILSALKRQLDRQIQLFTQATDRNLNECQNQC